MKTIIKLALKNVFRNKRRTVITLSIITFGMLSLFVTYGFINFSFQGLREQTIRQGVGHLQIFNPEGQSRGWIGGRGTVLEEELACIYETLKNLFNAPAFEFPTCIASDSHGNYFISDSGNHRILKFDACWNLRLAFEIGRAHV